MAVDAAPRRLAAYATTRAEGTRSLGVFACDRLDAAGVHLFDWQAETLDEWLEVVDDPSAVGGVRLTRTTAGLVVPRRNGKTLLEAARALIGIAFLDERRVLYTAHLGDTCQEIFGMMREVCSHPSLAELVGRSYVSNGKERIEFTNGGVFQTRTRTEHGGRGRETDLLFFDEAMVLSDASVAALFPLTAKPASAGRGQVIYSGSAGADTDEDSDVLRRIRDRGREASGTAPAGFSYREYSVDRRVDLDDPREWGAANPSLGTVVLAEGFLRDARKLMSVDAFGREHLGWWADGASAPVIDADTWAALAVDTPPEPLDAARWMTFDLAPDRLSARVLGYYRTADGRIAVSVLDSVDDPQGIDGDLYANRVLAIATDFEPEVIGFDRLTGDHVAQLLANHGWKDRLRPVSGTKLANGCASLVAAVKLGTIAHDGHADVVDDLGRAVAKPFADGGWIFSRKSATSGPIASAVALGIGFYLAADELLA